MNIAGLTGSIGMGKSATAAMFRALGIAVHDSDAAVHAIYNGAGAGAIEALFPGVTEGGRVNRASLALRVLGNPAALRRLEEAVHPLVAADKDAFLSKRRANGDRLAVLDIPLLFETGGIGSVDFVIVVSAPESVQKARVLARPGMTAERFAAILSHQLPDVQKRAGAHFIIETGFGLEAASTQVAAFIKSVCGITGG